MGFTYLFAHRCLIIPVELVESLSYVRQQYVIERVQYQIQEQLSSSPGAPTRTLARDHTQMAGNRAVDCTCFRGMQSLLPPNRLTLAGFPIRVPRFSFCKMRIIHIWQSCLEGSIRSCKSSSGGGISSVMVAVIVIEWSGEKV